jgi:hypothetical protein
MQNILWKAQFFSWSRNSCPFKKPEDLVPVLQVLTTWVLTSASSFFSLHIHAQFLKDRCLSTLSISKSPKQPRKLKFLSLSHFRRVIIPVDITDPDVITQIMFCELLKQSPLHRLLSVLFAAPNFLVCTLFSQMYSWILACLLTLRQQLPVIHVGWRASIITLGNTEISSRRRP